MDVPRLTGRGSASQVRSIGKYSQLADRSVG